MGHAARRVELSDAAEFHLAAIADTEDVAAERVESERGVIPRSLLYPHPGPERSRVRTEQLDQIVVHHAESLRTRGREADRAPRPRTPV